LLRIRFIRFYLNDTDFVVQLPLGLPPTGGPASVMHRTAGKTARFDQGRQPAREPRKTGRPDPREIGAAATALTPFQEQSVALFVRAAIALSLPRSVGQVYGLLFASPRPLNLDEIMALLGASRGGTFEGLKWLRQFGAVERVFLPGVRKEHFQAELNLRRLANGFLRLRIEPHLDNANNHLNGLRSAIDSDSVDAEFQHTRLGKVETWHRLLNDLLPMIKQVAAE
jgi:DNA-binding transcriptional regulator GbsR (MarR family)